ncbi:MAG TPA: tetratricopeptide repeat protein [Armatimonadetes bacterium]|nr:tetratricopeptide repeat protein [Armatimonadota bacterium]
MQASLWIRIAYLMLSNGRYHDTEIALKEVVDNYSRTSKVAEALMRLGYIAESKGLRGKAREYFASALFASRYREVFKESALFLLKTSEVDKCHMLLRRTCASQDSMRRVLHELYLCAVEGDFEPAISIKASQLLFLAGEFKKAVDVAMHVANVTDVKEDERVNALLTLWWLHRDDYPQKAEQFLNSALDKDLHGIVVSRFLAHLMGIRDFDAAVYLVDAALEHIKQPRLMLQKAFILHEIVGDFRGCLNVCEQVLRTAKSTDDERSIALLRMAYVYHAMRNLPKVEQILRQIISQYPETRASAIAKAELAFIVCSRKFDWEEASRLTQEAIDALNEDDEAVLTLLCRLAIFLGEKGDLQSAIEIYRRIFPTHRRGSDPHFDIRYVIPFELARCLAKMNRWKEAKEVIQKALEAYADLPDLVALLKTELLELTSIAPNGNG